MRILFNFIKLSLLVVFIIGIVYFFGDKIILSLRVLEQRYLPCQRALQYSTGNINPQFGIEEKELIMATEEAEKVWENQTNKNLFEYTENASLKINLIYDYRQEATERLKEMGINIELNRSTYEKLADEYDSLINQYQQQKSIYERDFKDYERRKQVYEDNVEYWNSRGGAPQNEYIKLEREKESFNMLVQQLNQKRDSINSLVKDINFLVSAINRVASVLNLDATKYNSINSERGDVFQQGLYKRDLSGEQIDIYQFDNKNQLVLVLAHELGHALGLEHSEDRSSIMYALNEGVADKLSESDITTIKMKCHL